MYSANIKKGPEIWFEGYEHTVLIFFIPSMGLEQLLSQALIESNSVKIATYSFLLIVTILLMKYCIRGKLVSV